MSPTISEDGAASAPTPTPLPKPAQKESDDQNGVKVLFTDAVSLPVPQDFSPPRLRLRLNDLTDIGTSFFLTNVNAATLMPSSVTLVQKALYGVPSLPNFHPPNIRGVTLFVRPMEGVAYTTGSDLDPELHKQIHLSSRYIVDVSPERRGREIMGVVVHELVHCFQYNGQGDAPGGLIEGIADWVRLKADLAAPHWRRGDELSGNWDAGYEHTAFFLDYLEERFGEGTVRGINEGLRVMKYEENVFWTAVLGKPVDQLWEDYKNRSSRST